MKNQRKKVVAVLSDLMFRVKIQEAAKRAGLEPVFAKTGQEALEQVKENPVAVIIDLNNPSSEPLTLIENLKSNRDTSKINLLAYVSHVNAELKQAALEKGCDLVMARSAFSQNLPTIMKRYASA
jgi:PleD family two-component response regulator